MASRKPIVDSTPVLQIHSEVKRQRERECSHIDTDEKLFLLMQESYPSTYDNYEITNHNKKIAILILNTSMVPYIMHSETRGESVSIDYHSILFQSQMVY